MDQRGRCRSFHRAAISARLVDQVFWSTAHIRRTHLSAVRHFREHLFFAAPLPPELISPAPPEYIITNFTRCVVQEVIDYNLLPLIKRLLFISLFPHSLFGYGRLHMPPPPCAMCRASHAKLALLALPVAILPARGRCRSLNGGVFQENAESDPAGSCFTARNSPLLLRVPKRFVRCGSEDRLFRHGWHSQSVQLFTHKLGGSSFPDRCRLCHFWCSRGTIHNQLP